MSGGPAISRPRVFYGWFVVTAAFAVTLIGFGSAYTFSAFIASLQRDFGASRGSVSLVFSLAGFLYFGLGLVSGPLADRWGARRLAVAGMILVGLGLVLAGLARDLNEVYAAYGLGIGLGIGCSYVPAIAAVQRWFARRRGFASGLAVSGIGVGTLVMPPLAALLIGLANWREAYVILGLLAASVGGSVALLLEDDPRSRGLLPDGDVRPAAAAAIAPAGVTVRAAIRSPRFAKLYAACLLCSLGAFVPFVHLVPSAMGRGVPRGAAMLLLSVMGVGSTVRFLLGGLADRFGSRRALVAVFTGMALTLLIWAFAATVWPFVLFALTYGMCYGGWSAVLPAVVVDEFGGRNVSGIMGVLYTSAAFGTLIGPSAAGFAFDASRSYTLPIVAGIVANLTAAGIVATMRRPGECFTQR